MLWIKAFHLIAMVAWFSGLFYLPRLFVYHTELDPKRDCVHYQRFNTMERRLYWGITTPSALITLALGLMLIYHYGATYFKHAHWLHAKLGLVFLLVIYHVICGYYLKQFKNAKNKHQARYFKWFNEVPVLFLISIILLATLKP